MKYQDKKEEFVHFKRQTFFFSNDFKENFLYHTLLHLFIK